MDNIIHPFSLPIYQDFVDKESFNVIREDTYNFIEKNQSLFRPVWFCPTLTTHGVDKKLNINISTLKTQIKKHTENYFKIWDFNKPYTLKIDETWVNISQKNSYQEEHHHSNSFFSGVLYINTNELGGEFDLINPLPSESILLDSPKNFDFSYKIKPQNGMILLFPGWFKHRVLANNSNEDRISISFNIIKTN